MLLHDDVEAERKAESGALTGRFGGKEGIEDLVEDLLRNTLAVVADGDHDRVFLLLCANFQQREIGVFQFFFLLVCRITGIVDDVQEDPADILRYDIHHSDRFVIIGFDLDVECIVLCPHAMIGKVDILRQHRVEVGGLLVA